MKELHFDILAGFTSYHVCSSTNELLPFCCQTEARYDAVSAMLLFFFQGYVEIFFGDPKKHKVAGGAANITIFCEKVGNSGL